MRFDWVISIGTVINIFTIAVGGVIALIKIVDQMKRLEYAHKEIVRDIMEIKNDIHEIRKEILSSLEKRVRELEIKIGN